MAIFISLATQNVLQTVQKKPLAILIPLILLGLFPQTKIETLVQTEYFNTCLLSCLKWQVPADKKI